MRTLNTSLLGLGLALCATASCSSTSTGSDTSVAPEVAALFQGLAPASPDRLRGVWTTKVASSGGSADLRLRFTDGKLILGVRCEFTAANTKPILIGQTGLLTSADLDGKTGQFVLPATVNAATVQAGNSCDGHFDAATWKFAVTGSVVEMDPVMLKGHVRLDKAGD